MKYRRHTYRLQEITAGQLAGEQTVESKIAGRACFLNRPAAIHVSPKWMP